MRWFEYEVMSVKIDEFFDTKAALELTDAIEAVLGIVFGGNTPEIVALYYYLKLFALGLHV